MNDIAEFSKESGYSKGDLTKSGTPIILYGRLYTKYETIISEVDTYVEAKDSSVYSKLLKMESPVLLWMSVIERLRLERKESWKGSLGIHYGLDLPELLDLRRIHIPS